jgi:hypothetical protein
MSQRIGKFLTENPPAMLYASHGSGHQSDLVLCDETLGHSRSAERSV